MITTKDQFYNKYYECYLEIEPTKVPLPAIFDPYGTHEHLARHKVGGMLFDQLELIIDDDINNILSDRGIRLWQRLYWRWHVDNDLSIIGAEWEEERRKEAEPYDANWAPSEYLDYGGVCYALARQLKERAEKAYYQQRSFTTNNNKE